MTSISAPVRRGSVAPDDADGGLHPERAVLAARLLELDAGGREAVLVRERALGADVAVEAVGELAGGLAVLLGHALRRAARVLDDAQAGGAAADGDGARVTLGAGAQALGLVGAAAVVPDRVQRAAGELVGPGRGHPAGGADRLALAGLGALEGHRLGAVGQRLAALGDRRTELGATLLVDLGLLDRLPLAALLDLQGNGATGLARLDGGGQAGLGRSGRRGALALADDLGQGHQARRGSSWPDAR